MRISERTLHRLLALVAFGLYFIYLMRATTSKAPMKLKNELPTLNSDTPISDSIHGLPRGDLPKVVDENQFKVSSTEAQSTIKDKTDSTPAEVL